MTCGAKGLGHILISANGVMPMRSPVDRAVYGPERVIFTGESCKKPVKQDKRKPEIWDGTVLDAEKFLFETDKTLDREALQRNIAALRAASQQEADAKADAWLEFHIKAAVAKGIKHKTAARQLGRMVKRVKQGNRSDVERDSRSGIKRDTEVLEADYIITLSDGKEVTVREICANPAAFENRRCADPIEGPSYGPTTAVIFITEAGRPWIFSHAHGATVDTRSKSVS